MARLPNFLVIIRSEKLSGKGQGRGAKKRTFRFGKKNVSFPKVETFRFADYKAFENYSACTPKTLLGFSIDGELVGKYALEHQSMSVLLSQYTPQLYLLNCESECNVEIFEMDDILKAKL